MRIKHDIIEDLSSCYEVERKAHRQRVVLADDLTGAMDAGVQLGKYSKDIYVKIAGMREADSQKLKDILILDTESRNVSPDEAYSTILESLSSLKACEAEIIYKKIDSSLRGNVGKELEAIIHSGVSSMIALVPALPQSGRTTSGGFHYLNGSLLGESDLAKDPFAPVKSSYIPELVSLQTDLPTGLIFIEETRRGKEYISSRFECLYNEGVRVAVCDAETVGDLEHISGALKECKIKVLPCGSAGLLSMLQISSEPADKQEDKYTTKRGPVLVISGSPAKASKEQVKVAYEKGMEVLKLSDYAGNISQLKEKACNILKSGSDLIIDGSGEGKNEITMQYKGDINRLNEDSRKIQKELSETTVDIVSTVQLSGMMIIGGDTAAAVCRRLGAGGIKLAGEVEPLVPWGLLQGGNANNLKIVTKAGGFGRPDVIIYTAATLKGE